MRRPVLLTLAAVGGVIVLLSGSGLFAALSDTARSGTNSIDSEGLPPSSDLRVAAAALPQFSGQPVSCATFGDDLTSPLISISVPPAEGLSQFHPYCLRNVGSQTVLLSVLVEEFNNVELDCTGDERAYDESCGSGPGELDQIVRAEQYAVNCQTGVHNFIDNPHLAINSNVPMNLGVLGPGETRCFYTLLTWSAPDDLFQAAQSDRLSWRFAWTGQVP